MICKYCGQKMRLDDVDKNFKGNKDNYFCCDNSLCLASCIEEIRFNKLFRQNWHKEIPELIDECSCMTCNHPACVFRGESDHYCGNYMTAKPYTLKLVLGGMKGEQSVKDRVCTGNDNHGNCNASTNNNDSASDTRH